MTMLETERLLLRTWTEADVVPFSLMNGDPQVMEYFPSTLSSEESLQLYQRITAFMENRGFGLFAVELKRSHEFMGFIGLNEPTFTAAFTPCVEIGWRLARPFWGQGFATEGAKACLDFGFSTLHLQEIVSFTSKLNLKSIAVMERIGMQYAGEFEHPKLEPGHRLRTHVLYRKEVISSGSSISSG